MTYTQETFKQDYDDENTHKAIYTHYSVVNSMNRVWCFNVYNILINRYLSDDTKYKLNIEAGILERIRIICRIRKKLTYN